MKAKAVALLSLFLVWTLISGLPAQPVPELSGELARADAARAGGKLAEAAEIYGEIVSRWPEDQRGWWFLCTTLYDLERWPEAVEAAVGLTARWPEYGPGFAMLGVSLIRIGEYPRALEALQKSRVLGLGDQEALQRVVRYHGGILLNRLGFFEGAFQALKGFAYSDQRSGAILDAYGLSMLRLPYLPWEIPAERRSLVRRVGEATWDWEVGRRDQAKESFRALLAEHPREPNLHYSFGALILYSDPDGALAEFLKELEVNPSSLHALAQIALEYIRRGQFEDALPYAERATVADPASPIAQFALGQVKLETGELEEALRRLERSLELAPMKPEVHFVLARAYQRSGRAEDARKHFREFERLNQMMKEADEFLSREGKTP